MVFYYDEVWWGGREEARDGRGRGIGRNGSEQMTTSESGEPDDRVEEARRECKQEAARRFPDKAAKGLKSHKRLAVGEGGAGFGFKQIRGVRVEGCLGAKLFME